MIGVLSWFSFATADRPIGVTTSFENTAALAARAVVPNAGGVEAHGRHREEEGRPVRIDWEWMLVIGVFAGAWISSRLSGDRDSTLVPPLWSRRFGDSPSVRILGAFVGGFLMLLGARLAGGCTSGHGISGSLQLAVSSWIFVAMIFAAGIATAFLLFGRGGADHV
jgi:hypothetical protein